MSSGRLSDVTGQNVSGDYEEIPIIHSAENSGQQHANVIARPPKKQRSLLGPRGSKGTSKKAVITRVFTQGTIEEGLEEGKEGDAERIKILKMFKEGLINEDEAMKLAKEKGVAPEAPAASPARDESEDMEEKIYNFGVYKYGKSKAGSSRSILQFDFQEKVLCMIEKGNRNKKFNFSEITGFDSEDGVRFQVYFEDRSDYELDADSMEEKIKVCRLLDSIIQQNMSDVPDGEIVAPSLEEALLIKEGQVEKKGHSAAFMMWPRRWLRIQQGELSYHKSGEENQPALNIIKLGPGLAETKKVDHNIFVVTTSKKEYSFRVVNLNNSRDIAAIENERDEWIQAIDEASLIDRMPRRTRGPSLSDETAVAYTFDEQEQYVKGVVQTLQRELEQLTSVLSVVNAPISATIQVKKVKDVVKNLDTQVRTGVLSWAMRQQMKAKSLERSRTSPPHGSYISSMPGGDGYESVNMLKRDSPSSKDSSPPPSTSPPAPPVRAPYPSGRQECLSPSAKSPKIGSPSERHVSPYETVSIFSRGPQVESPSEGYCSPSVPGFGPQSPPGPGGGLVILQGDSQGQALPRRPPKPGATGQEPQKALEDVYRRPQVAYSGAYDNFRLKNIPLSHGEVASDIVEFDCVEQDEHDAGGSRKKKKSASMKREQEKGTPESPSIETQIDAGGMGCTSIEEAIQERRSYLKETKSEGGVVLLSVQKRTEETASDDEAPSNTAPPPPPLPPGGIPAPPPPPGGLNPNLPPVPGIQSKLKLRPLFWNKVPAALVANSMWMTVEDKSKSIDIEMLEDFFQIEEKEKPQAAVTAKPSSKCLLDPRRAQNLGIFLSGFKLTSKEIEHKLSLFREEEGALPMDHVIALKRFLPTTEEQEMYRNYKDDTSSLLPEDQFMLRLCDIPDLEKRLDLLLVLMEFPVQFEELQPAVENLLRACHELHDSKKFLMVLQYVLSIGNILNGGTNRAAHGFKLTTLPKLVDIRGKNKKVNLLKFLIGQLQKTDADSLDFTTDLKSVPEAAKVSIKGLSAEVEVMKKDLTKIKKHSNDLFLKRPQTEPRDVKFVKDVEEFFSEYEGRLEDLCSKCKQMKQIYNKLLVQFGEQTTADSEELMGAVSTFMGQFDRALRSERQQTGSKKKPINASVLGSTSSNEDTVSISSTPSSSSVSTSASTENDCVDAANPFKLQKLPDSKPGNSNAASSPKVVQKQLSTKKPQTAPKPLTLPKPTKQGYLDKLSGGKHQTPKWDTRFFELTKGGHLHYYKKPDGKIIHSIYLRGCPVELDEQDPSMIVIRTEEREWSLRAVNVDEARSWMDALCFYANNRGTTN